MTTPFTLPSSNILDNAEKAEYPIPGGHWRTLKKGTIEDQCSVEAIMWRYFIVGTRLTSNMADKMNTNLISPEESQLYLNPN